MKETSTEAPSVVAKGTSKKLAKATKKAAAEAVAAKVVKPRKTAPDFGSGEAAKPVLLSGGNPQIAKGYGDAPVQAYIAAMPGWKSDVGRRLDTYRAHRPRRAQGGQMELALLWRRGPCWFLASMCFTKYVKVTFFRGASLKSCPPRRVQVRGSALPRHLRGPARRSSVRRLGEASQPIARRTDVSVGSLLGRSPRALTSDQKREEMGPIFSERESPRWPRQCLLCALRLRTSTSLAHNVRSATNRSRTRKLSRSKLAWRQGTRTLRRRRRTAQGAVRRRTGSDRSQRARRLSRQTGKTPPSSKLQRQKPPRREADAAEASRQKIEALTNANTALQGNPGGDRCGQDRSGAKGSGSARGRIEGGAGCGARGDRRAHAGKRRQRHGAKADRSA